MKLFPVCREEGYPGHVHGDGGSQYDDVPHLAEFEQVPGTVVHGGCLARALLPVQQRIAFLQDKVQVVFLERGEPAYVTVLVDEGRMVKVIDQPCVRLHVCKLPVLDFIPPAFFADQFLRRADFTHVLLCRELKSGQFGTAQHEIVDACRLVRHLVQQSRGVLFQFETV